jgi:hypothetical protein
MGLSLHDKCRERLVENVSEELADVVVKNRMFLERKSTVGLLSSEQILPKTGPIQNKLKEYVSETPLFDFLYETLSRELYENQKYDSEATLIKLSEVEGYQDLSAKAQRLIDDFNSLPWDYSLTIKLDNDFGELFSQSIKQFTVCDNIRLTTPDENFSTTYALQSGIESRDHSLSGRLGLSSILSTEKWDRGRTYFQIFVKGFIGIYGETVPLQHAISSLKSFCGIAIAIRLFKVNHTYRPIPSKINFFIHRNIENKWIIERVHELDSSISETYSDLVMHDLNGSLDTPEKKVKWIRRNLNIVKTIFSNERKANKILLAGQWLFESFSGRNELLSFIQTTVALEILLGEKSISDLMGLGELLRNRCAYLIGKSQKQREQILQDFKEIYQVRSRIIHRGKSKLDFKERTLFSKLQWMCRRVIQEEINLVAEDIKKNA